MKITKNKHSYNIRVNENEKQMLAQLIDATPVDAVRRMLHGDVRAAYTRRFNATGGDLLKVDKVAKAVPLSGAAVQAAK